MGVKLTDLLVIKPVGFEDLKNKVIAVDASIFLYQFLSTIRQRDGSLLLDSKGNVTSHLVGLFTRTITLLTKGIKPVYVFDGAPPKLKHLTQKLRVEAKKKAMEKYESAISKGYLEEAKKYASRTSKLTPDMVNEAKELLVSLGLPIVQAPSEGEAQASFLVKQDDAFAVASQDEDCLIFGAPRLLRNLSITGHKKVKGKVVYQKVLPEIVDLAQNLNHLGLDYSQLIILAILIGTDYNPGGVKGLGPKKALSLVKKFGKDFDSLFNSIGWDYSISWREIYDTIVNMPVTKEYSLNFKPIQVDKVKSLLCDKHDFSEARVDKLLNPLIKKNSQSNLSSFFG